MDGYLNDVNKIKLLTTEEEVELAEKIKQWDSDALQKLVKANLRFVISVAQQYKMQNGIPLEDLIQSGNIGLIKAAKKYDPTKWFKFISYAVRQIKKEILESIYDEHQTIKVSKDTKTDVKKIQKITDDYIAKHWEIPTDEYIVIQLNKNKWEKKNIYTLEDVQNIRQKNVWIYPLESKSETDENSKSLIEILSVEDAEDEDKIDRVRSWIKNAPLKQTQKEIIQWLYGIGTDKQKAGELAKQYELTTARIRQIEETAKNVIKNTAKAKIDIKNEIPHAMIKKFKNFVDQSIDPSDDQINKFAVGNRRDEIIKVYAIQYAQQEILRTIQGNRLTPQEKEIIQIYYQTNGNRTLSELQIVKMCIDYKDQKDDLANIDLTRIQKKYPDTTKEKLKDLITKIQPTPVTSKKLFTRIWIWIKKTPPSREQRLDPE
jgi:RNA polymerase primary sigma factor